MGPNTEFKQWKRNFLTFLSLKATYLIPELTIRESGVWLDEHTRNFAYALMLHNATENKRADQTVMCVSVVRPDYAIAAWDIMCERLDGQSFARSLSLLDSLMLMQRLGYSMTDYVHFLRQTFDDYNETRELIDGSAAIHPHNPGLLILRSISSNGPSGQAKHCVINAFDTNYLVSADKVMVYILHLARNMDDDLTYSTLTALMAQPLY
jgi:hypothetical protein